MQWLNARGIIPGRAGTLVLPPENAAARQQVANAARTILFGHLALAMIFALTGLWQLILLVDLAAFIGNGLPNLLASAQHCGMKVDTLDYRENSRTVLLNPIISFFYWNMNYHVEHHMYPGVPCYHLPRLRKLLEADLGPATLGISGIVKAMRQDHATRRLGDCSLNAA
jgi:fatty acid desaturase